MTYQQAVDYLFSALPMYQRVGKSAFKKDLNNTLRLCEVLGNPQHQFKSVHVAGTNGKGSSSHMIASVLQEAGYKTGLYTSPHLKHFTERTRINGQPMDEASVVNFVLKYREAIDEIRPSFFEMSVNMAFEYFAINKVDIAVIEVGLGGRLDSTNVISPEVGLITNIGMDHMDMLGDTLAKIAYEKAGIIKTGIPVVIGSSRPETKPVFEQVAKERAAPIHYAQEERNAEGIETDLRGDYQQLNLPGVLSVFDRLNEKGWKLSADSIGQGLRKVVTNTGLKGRWQQLSEKPLTICDTGHNVDGVTELVKQINGFAYDHLYLVLGFVSDKNVGEVLRLFPNEANFIFCEAKVPRAMPLNTLRTEAEKLHITADYVTDVNEALELARIKAGEGDFIFVGGSTFVVAELNEL